MAKREYMSKKLRFEVFKRDSFTCQYCGRSAPEVILHVDHILPVSKDGDNSIINLITACADCNGGKGARELSDDAVLAKRKKQVDELQERREQLEMMSEWQQGLMELENEEVDRVAEILDSMTPGWNYNEHGKIELRKLIANYTAVEVIGAAKTIRDQYVVLNDEGIATQESVQRFTAILPKVCKNQILYNHNPYLGKFLYIGGILRNRFDVRVDSGDIKLLCQATDCGVNVEDLIDHAKYVKSYLMWRRNVRELIDEATDAK